MLKSQLVVKLAVSDFVRWKLIWAFSMTLVIGVFFFGFFVILKSPKLQALISPVPVIAKKNHEVFGFAPFWTLSKLDNIDWDTLTTFAYFSIPVNADGTLDRYSYEWNVFEGDKLRGLFDKAKENKVKRVVTLTQMEMPTIEAFLSNETAWDTVAYESVEIVRAKNLDGVNIDFEYILVNDYLKEKFSRFVEKYAQVLNDNLDNPYITVSVLASSVKENKIYDIGRLAKATDGVFMMAYDFYYRGSDEVGPSAPLYGYNNGKGPFWYDVSTAVDDFLKVADASKIIMGVPYYGWNYPADEPDSKSARSWGRVSATTNEKAQNNQLLTTTPIGGWDSQAQVSWRSYWDENGWHVVYMEDERSLSAKYDFAKSRNLKGVGIWALGFDAESDNLWSVLSEKFEDAELAAKPTHLWIF